MTDTATAPATDINIAPDALPAAPATPSVEQQQQINVEKARARRNEILADKTLTKKLMEGDPDLRAEMTRLNATIAGQDIGSAIQSSLNGAEPSEWSNITTEGILSKEEYASADGILRPHSALREIFAEFAAGATVSQERHNEAKMIKEMVLSDPQWRAAYLSGSLAHKQQMTRLNATLVAPIAKGKK